MALPKDTAVPRDPLELLTPDEFHEKTYLHNKYVSLVLGGSALGFCCWRNYTAGRPAFSGIHIHAIWTALGLVAGKFIYDRQVAYYADRDAVLRHYVQLHPEDFPVPEPKRLKDIFKPWHPVR